MSSKLQSIDELLRQEHSYLRPEDDCYFYGDYTVGGGYHHSKMNDLIFNFKKSVEKKGTFI